jgi:cysteine synthase A
MGTIIRSILDLQENVFLCLHDFLGPHRDVYLKLEGLNAPGSVKFKPARQMIEDLEERGIIQSGCHKIVESSSGNLGVALALVCKVKGYPFTCVTDPNANPAHLAHIRRYGGEVVMVTQRDANGGFLQTRLALIRQMLRDDPTCVWTNQYANPANPQHTTARPGRRFTPPSRTWITCSSALARPVR